MLRPSLTAALTEIIPASLMGHVETIAVGRGIRQLKMLRKRYGGGRWRKRKGIARVEFDGERRTAEVHWYESHGVGRVLLKVKRFLLES